ncbi:hypothetical protein E1B28_007235 [Marasmius oreades]|uniref:Large ribosomal subunit protein uL23m n=1 Tax=Marasmius oreades TaxID=181124 RepID=A0A9P7S1Y0_9AGAR|nr:uncharacterized protein E1B28_007235 [Marasmius oreades]KAG7093565.1 hypothetical protein E1B28_007235 [Marasmius oreades]
MLGTCFRRSYRTKASPHLPKGAQVARTESTPLAVRLRRERDLGPVKAGETDAAYGGLTPSEVARYNRYLAMGTLPKIDGKPLTQTQYLERLSAKRSRIRGIRTVKRDDKEVVEVVGQPIYLPNMIFRLVRNHTLEGQDYNPYEATFRIPLSVTKNDVRSYLFSAYGVKTTYVRTDIRYGKHHSTINRPSPLHPFRRLAAYKRAVVGLVDPFYYPHRVEDMPLEEKQERREFMEESFHVKETRANEVKANLQAKAKQFGSDMQTWKYRGDPKIGKNRGNILRAVAQRRILKEKLVSEQVKEWQRKRAKGETIELALPSSKKAKKKPVDGAAPPAATAASPPSV